MTSEIEFHLHLRLGTSFLEHKTIFSYMNNKWPLLERYRQLFTFNDIIHSSREKIDYILVLLFIEQNVYYHSF